MFFLLLLCIHLFTCSQKLIEWRGEESHQNQVAVDQEGPWCSALLGDKPGTDQPRGVTQVKVSDDLRPGISSSLMMYHRGTIEVSYNYWSLHNQELTLQARNCLVSRNLLWSWTVPLIL